MAQGKLKVKSKKPAALKSKNGRHKPAKNPKKGSKLIAPKKGQRLELHKLHKSIQKGIHKNIEETLASRASQVEEGKAFNVLKAPEAPKDKKSKK